MKDIQPKPEQEPVGSFGYRDGEYRHILEQDDVGDYPELIELYTHPLKREPLSEEVLTTLWSRNPVIGHTKNEFIMLARVIEKALGVCK